MSPSRFVRPHTTVLPISDGDTITIRTRLNAGEQRAYFARLYLAGADGELHVNPLQSRIARVTAYLLDWTLADERGAPVVIQGEGPEALTAILDGLDPEAFLEISDAISAHVTAQDKARAALKNAPAGETPSSAISLSPSAPAGASSGSAS